MKVDYFNINKPALSTLLDTKRHLSLIDNRLKAIVELQVSQINGCAYCLNLQSVEARKLGESQQRLDCLAAWKESNLFSKKEMAALDWAEKVTNISFFTDLEACQKTVLHHFSEQELVDLTLVISVMNSLNRLAISFEDSPKKEMQ